MGKQAKTNRAKIVSTEEQATKGFNVNVQLPVKSEREIEAAIRRHEMSAGEKKRRRAELRAAQNRPWKTELPAVIDLQRVAGLPMQAIAAQFYRDVAALGVDKKKVG